MLLWLNLTGPPINSLIERVLVKTAVKVGHFLAREARGEVGLWFLAPHRVFEELPVEGAAEPLYAGIGTILRMVFFEVWFLDGLSFLSTHSKKAGLLPVCERAY